ncbi:MAG: hypothetical protein OJJ54_00280 [Pseudonocardia sp.]|nr:hypothetical protein [Pseudonocardia sp.]
MYLQIITFDGPRSAAVVEAARRAGRERIAPLVEANPELRAGLLGGFRAVGPDGAECVVQLARDAAALDTLEQVVMSSELLPGEDPALLSGPSRAERYVVSDAFGPLSELVAGAER